MKKTYLPLPKSNCNLTSVRCGSKFDNSTWHFKFDNPTKEQIQETTKAMSERFKKDEKINHLGNFPKTKLSAKNYQRFDKDRDIN